MNKEGAAVSRSREAIDRLSQAALAAEAPAGFGRQHPCQLDSFCNKHNRLALSFHHRLLGIFLLIFYGRRRALFWRHRTRFEHCDR